MAAIKQRRRYFAVPRRSASRRLSACARDALHRVTAKRVNGAVTQGWIYKDGLAPVAETDADGNVVSFFVYGTSALSPDYMTKDGSTYRLIRDFQGSVRLVVDADTGAVVQRLDYDSFGNVSQDTNPGFQPFGFKSGLYDSDTGLVHFGARWYDPATGRWISKDPILLAGGLNLYAFCGNDPVNFSDPWGLCEKTGREKFQTALDAIGVFDPTGIADGLNALIYLWNGENGYAAISALGMVPYLGDLGKAGKYGSQALRYSDEAAALIELAKQAKRTGVSTEDAQTLLKWAEEYGVEPALDHTIPPLHWDNTPHIRIGQVNHIEVLP
jgi:RHS repeat-associated protein